MLFLIIIFICLAAVHAISCKYSGDDCVTCTTNSCQWCVKSERCIPTWQGKILCPNEERADELLKCPVSPNPSDNYTDDFGRNTMHPLSVAAYSHHPQNCFRSILQGVEVKFYTNDYCHDTKTQNCSGFLALYPSQKAIILSFRGSKEVAQVASQAFVTVFQSKDTLLADFGKIHPYFKDSFNEVWNRGMKNIFVNMTQENPEFEVWLTGHSLGGAMASIAALMIVKDNLATTSKVKLVTFGAPRVGDRVFAKKHNELVKYSYRVVKRDDMIPHVPSRRLAGYFHHRHEIWYNNDMNVGDPWQLCTTEGNTCSNDQMWKRSYEDHVIYFGKRYSIYVKELCD